jgi:Na+/H+-translocating membrane pyrophosphatase
VGFDVSNLTDARQQVRDRNGIVPNRLQPDYLDAIGRTTTITLRKLF